MPSDIGIIDTMIDFPHQDMAATYKFITQQTRDAENHPPPRYHQADRSLGELVEPRCMFFGHAGHGHVRRRHGFPRERC